MLKKLNFRSACKLRANKKGFERKTLETPVNTSGEDRARTDDLLTASQAL